MARGRVKTGRNYTEIHPQRCGSVSVAFRWRHKSIEAGV